MGKNVAGCDDRQVRSSLPARNSLPKRGRRAANCNGNAARARADNRQGFAPFTDRQGLRDCRCKPFHENYLRPLKAFVWQGRYLGLSRWNFHDLQLKSCSGRAGQPDSFKCAKDWHTRTRRNTPWKTRRSLGESLTVGKFLNSNQGRFRFTRESTFRQLDEFRSAARHDPTMVRTHRGMHVRVASVTTC